MSWKQTVLIGLIIGLLLAVSAILWLETITNDLEQDMSAFNQTGLESFENGSELIVELNYGEQKTAPINKLRPMASGVYVQ